MTYQARQNADTWDLLDPNGNAVATGYSYPCQDDDPQVMADMWTHASSNGFIGEALQTVNRGFERV